MIKHGLTRYKKGPGEDGQPGKCRCPRCRAANAAWQANRSRMIAYDRWDGWEDAAGTRRRIQALVRNGWSMGLLSARLGITRQVLRGKVVKRARVTAATAGKVRALYDELWDQPPPQQTKQEKRNATMARRLAAERGWVPPLAWDDDEIDDPAAIPAPGWDRDGQAASPLAAAIRQAREQAAMSRPRLAAVIGVSASAVQWWECGESVPNEQNWVQLELALGPLGVVRDAGPETAAREERDAAA